MSLIQSCPVIFALTILTLTGVIRCQFSFLNEDLFNSAKEEPLDASCSTCRNVIKSFKNGIENTSRGAYDGGDTSWESRSSVKYADSELRLTEIQEDICEDIYNGKSQCIEMSQQHEETIEDWWLKLRSKGVELFDHLCVDKLKVCCPENHFGPTCEPCTGHPDNVCNGHGRCNGSGTRNGTGACDCYAGYTSDQCQDCKSNYLRVDDKCEKCDSGCEDGCHSLGPKGCLSCAKGYYEHEELGCQDVNECLPVDNNPCASATMCVNTNGSYECMPCHKSCGGCAEKVDNCTSCAKGFAESGDKCVLIREHQRTTSKETMRYLLYVFITVICSILMKWKPMLSLLAVIFFSIYIALNEYAIENSLSSMMEVYAELFD